MPYGNLVCRLFVAQLHLGEYVAHALVHIDSLITVCNSHDAIVHFKDLAPNLTYYLGIEVTRGP